MALVHQCVVANRFSFDTTALSLGCTFPCYWANDASKQEYWHENDHEYVQDQDHDHDHKHMTKCLIQIHWDRVASSSRFWWWMTNDVSNLEASSNGGALLPFKSRTWAALNHNLVLLHNHTTNKINLQIFAMKLCLLFQTAWVPSRKPVGEGEDVEGVRQGWPSWKHSLPLLLPFCKWSLCYTNPLQLMSDITVPLCTSYAEAELS